MIHFCDLAVPITIIVIFWLITLYYSRKEIRYYKRKIEEFKNNENIYKKL